MEKLTIQQGDSVTIAIILPFEKMNFVEDISVFLGDINVGQLTKSTLFITSDTNVFHVRLTSNTTQLLNGIYSILISVDYSDLGVRKTPKDKFLIVIEENNNVFANESISTVVDATIEINVVNNNLTTNLTLATFYRGYSALDVFRMEHDMPNASNDDMVQFSLMRERKSFFVGNINYIGVAKLGSSDEQEVWKITKIVIAENGQTLVTRANNVAWNNKLTINYN